jgi:ABC-type transport system involved in multi-copper enzyme maturation permease subunit
MHYLATITWLTFHQARRQRMVLLALVLGGLFVLLFALGFWLILREMQQAASLPSEAAQRNIYNFLLMAGLYVVHFLTVMISILASVDTISGEIASHTIQSIATKPVRRWQIVLGKWLGYALMMSLYLGLLSGGILLVVYLLAGYVPPNPLPGVGLLILEALVLLSLSLLGSTRFATLTNGVALFMLYGLAFIGSWVEQIGAALQSDAAVRIGIISSLVLPVEALWRRAAYLMQPPLTRELPASPFSATSVPSSAMVIYALVYAIAALALAIYSFQQRDL